jgi:2-desacetyl-2-hydroxyethyl bacteriochlorophyllide A dehydrogenase
MLPKMLKKVTFVDNQAKIVEEEIPALEPGQILVKTKVSLISPGTERAALTRLWDDAGFRASPGYALAGEVIEIGSQVNGFNVGDRVITLKNHASYSVTTIEPWTTLKIPDGVSPANSTFLPLASVAMHALRRLQVQLGDTVAIIGAGIIGQIATQLARMYGAQKIIVLDMADNRLALASHYGADLTINPGKEDAVEKLFAFTQDQGAPAILEATGNTKVLPMAFKLAAVGGRICLAGVMEEPHPLAFHQEFLLRELTLVASHQPHCPVTENIYYRWTQQENRRLVLALLAQGKLKVSEMITHRFPASKAPDAYERIKAGDTDMLGALLVW